MTYPKKPADNKYQIAEIIKNRWSPRLFSDKDIEEEKIMSLFEAARWAPSSFNEQPWRFVYALKKDAQEFNRFISFLNEGNTWAKKAPLLIAVFAKRTFDYNGKSNYNAMYDTGAGAYSLFLEAVNQGLVAHEMIGLDKEKAERDLNIPENFKLAAMIAVGYPATEEKLQQQPEEVKRSELAPRERLSIEQIAFKGSWQK